MGIRLINPSVVWNFDTFDNNFVIHHKIPKYLNEIYGLDFDKHVSIKYFSKNSLTREISLKQSGGLGSYRHEWVNNVMILDQCARGNLLLLR